ncbi:MAG TPA: hypothetical protein ACHBZ9_01890 [Arsenophonus nasoniae]|uniref:hypothetical protein n=1 Tax=Arsenophonus nasoniae TaxID=638 RepID=UPI003879DC69
MSEKNAPEVIVKIKADDSDLVDEKKEQIKLSKLFIGGVFKGYALTVKGKILSNLESTVVESKPQVTSRVKASFIVTDEMIVDAPDIHLKDYIYRSAEEVNA